MEKIILTILILCSVTVIFAQWIITEENANRNAIQCVINMATSGEDITVLNYGGGGQGTYGGFDYIRKGLDIHSQNSNMKVPIYDVNTDVVIDMTEIDWDPTHTARLSGFEITGRSDAIGVSVTDFGGLYVDIENNIIEGLDTAIYLEDNSSSIRITSNELYGNVIGLFSAESSVDFSYNNVFDNSTAGLYLGLYTVIYADYNLFYDNSVSIHLTALQPDLYLYQCTISNTATNNYDTGIYADDDSDLTVINSILYGNDITIDDQGGDISITYSDIKGGYTGIGNINLIPNFCLETGYEFKLIEGSPCIDAGAANQTDSDGTRIDMGCYPSTTDYKLCEGNHWNWVSFPRLDRVNNGAVDAPTILEEFLCFPFDMELEGVISTVLDYTESTNTWAPTTYDIQSTDGFKLNPYEHGKQYLPSVAGALRLDQDDNWQLPNLAPNTDHFIGYWLPNTQNIVDAFGDLFDDVYSVKGEDWVYIYSTLESPTSSTVKKNLVYGKAYIINFKERIVDFQWDDGGGIGLLCEKQESETFIYNDLPCYEAIDVMNIPEDVVEIGVFEDDVCVGAVVVEETSEQILAYTSSENRVQNSLSFEVVYNTREGTQKIENYLVMDLESGIFENRSLIAGRQKHSVITFGNPVEFPEDDQVVDCVVLKSNYPNPFNPVTNIGFNLSEEQMVELNVYNMKGQMIRQLVKGCYSQGEHSVIWDGIDNSGNTVSSGLYMYKLKTSDQIISKKMLMLK